jgi:hypothetical protein
MWFAVCLHRRLTMNARQPRPSDTVYVKNTRQDCCYTVMPPYFMHPAILQSRPHSCTGSNGSLCTSLTDVLLTTPCLPDESAIALWIPQNRKTVRTYGTTNSQRATRDKKVLSQKVNRSSHKVNTKIHTKALSHTHTHKFLLLPKKKKSKTRAQIDNHHNNSKVYNHRTTTAVYQSPAL